MTTIGKRWRRATRYRDRSNSEWKIGEYVEYVDPTKVGIKWVWAVAKPGVPHRGDIDRECFGKDKPVSADAKEEVLERLKRRINQISNLEELDEMDDPAELAALDALIVAAVRDIAIEPGEGRKPGDPCPKCGETPEIVVGHREGHFGYAESCGECKCFIQWRPAHMIDVTAYRAGRLFADIGAKGRLDWQDHNGHHVSIEVD